MTYDVAVSFSGAQRVQVEAVVRACERLDVTVFYDADNTATFWGRNFIREMRKIYDGGARYVVPFLSKEYLAGAYPRDEFNTAMRRALEQIDEPYILPVLVGDVEVPADLLGPEIGYLKLEDYTPDGLAVVIAEQLGKKPAAVGSVRLPRLPVTGFDQAETLQAALARVGDGFRREAGRLIPYGLQCTVLTLDQGLKVRVERQGRTICHLWLRFDGTGRLVASLSSTPVNASTYGSWVVAGWDSGKHAPRLEYHRVTGKAEPADDLFRLLWDELVDFVDAS